METGQVIMLVPTDQTKVLRGIVHENWHENAPVPVACLAKVPTHLTHHRPEGMKEFMDILSTTKGKRVWQDPKAPFIFHVL